MKKARKKQKVFENGTGDYTKEREEELKNISFDDIISSIKKRKGQ